MRPSVHDGDTVRQFQQQRQVVGDEDDREAQLAPQPEHLREDLALHHDVDSRCRLVHHHQLGPAGQGQGDGGTLAHAAGQLVRMVADAVGGYADQGEQFNGPRPGVPLAQRAVAGPQDVGELGTDPHHRVQRVHGGLEHDGQRGPPVAAHPPAVERDEIDGRRTVTAMEEDLPAVVTAGGRCSRVRAVISVDFPEPDSPATPRISPGAG